MYKDKKVFVLGMARSGFEVAKLLGKDNKVFITDMKEQNPEHVQFLKDLGVEFKLCDNPQDYIDDTYDYLIKNPGIKYTHPCVIKARELNIPVINEVEVAFSFLKNNTNVIGITGSNGKTTTTTMIYEIMKAAYSNVHLAGNIGYPLCSIVNEMEDDGYLIIEISDHQLCDMSLFKTNVSVLTNISEVHIDFHDSFDRYKLMKKRIFNNHTCEDLSIINYDNEEAMNLSANIESQKEYFSTSSKTKCYYEDGGIYYDNKKIIDTEKLIVKGIHNYENIMAAILVCKHYDVDDTTIQHVLYNFKGVEHRIEYVTDISGRRFYNDSKSTNVEATKTALNAFNNPTILLLGGLDRGHSFNELVPEMDNVKLVVCFGETKERIKEFCINTGFDCIVCDVIPEAVKIAYEHSSEGDVILLSPACASWDQFERFEDRGDLFKECVKKLGE